MNGKELLAKAISAFGKKEKVTPQPKVELPYSREVIKK